MAAILLAKKIYVRGANIGLDTPEPFCYEGDAIFSGQVTDLQVEGAFGPSPAVSRG